MKTFEVLERALALIEDEKDWCQGGGGWYSDEEGATLCAEGSLFCVLGMHPDEQMAVLVETEPYRSLSEACGCREVFQFNDHHTHAEVVALFQRAIRNEKAKEGIPLEVEAPAEVLS